MSFRRERKSCRISCWNAWSYSIKRTHPYRQSLLFTFKLSSFSQSLWRVTSWTLWIQVLYLMRKWKLWRLRFKGTKDSWATTQYLHLTPQQAQNSIKYRMAQTHHTHHIPSPFEGLFGVQYLKLESFTIVLYLSCLRDWVLAYLALNSYLTIIAPKNDHKGAFLRRFHFVWLINNATQFFVTVNLGFIWVIIYLHFQCCC